MFVDNGRLLRGKVFLRSFRQYYPRGYHQNIFFEFQKGILNTGDCGGVCFFANSTCNNHQHIWSNHFDIPQWSVDQMEAIYLLACDISQYKPHKQIEILCYNHHHSRKKYHRHFHLLENHRLKCTCFI